MEKFNIFVARQLFVSYMLNLKKAAARKTWSRELFRTSHK
jgi:hypothetical protein